MKNKIEAIVGAGNVSSKEEDLFVYKQDSSLLCGNPCLVAWPSTTEEVSRIIKLCNVRNMPVVARGGGTTTAGCFLAEDALVLDLSKMNKIVQLHVTKQSVTVQPAVTIRQLQQFLLSQDFFFPIIPHTVHGVSTIGGLISRNACSPCSGHFGKFGDWTMSLEVVDGTGKVFSPSKVPFFVGSEGILGIITQATLKLTRPLPFCSGTWKRCLSQEELDAALQLVTDKDVLAAEYVDAHCAQMLGKEDKPFVWIEYLFLDKGEVKDQIEIAKIRAQLAQLYALLKQQKFTLHTDPFVPPDGVSFFLNFCRRNSIPVYGHLAQGVFHACVRKEHAETAHRVHKLAQKLHGYPSGEFGIGRAWKAYVPEQKKQELQEHKKFYDPSGILNPGCLL